MKKLLLLLLLSLGLNAVAEEICYGREDGYGITTETVILKKNESDHSKKLNFYDRPPSELFKYCDVGDILYIRSFSYGDSLARVIATYCDLKETHIVNTTSVNLVCRLAKARRIKQ